MLKIYPAYVSKSNSNREKQVILLMILSREKYRTKSKGWRHYLAVKKLSVLLRGIIFKKVIAIFIVWIVFILLEQETNLNRNKNICENKSFSSVILTSEDTKILEFNQYQKSDKASLIIYADLEW